VSVLSALPLVERERMVRELTDTIVRLWTESGQSLSEQELLRGVVAEHGCTLEDAAYTLSRLGALTHQS